MPEVLTAPAPPLKPFKPLKASYRIDSIDLLRGLVMIIMALDHTRDFFHKDAWTDDPLNLQTTTPILYFTRWITHLCAPIFVFLAGSGAYFQSLRKSRKQLSLFLIKRGLWLIFIELVVLNFAFSFDIHYHLIVLQTIWSIAISMIILGLMVWLPFATILATGLIIVLGHNSLDFYERTHNSPGFWYNLLHEPGQEPLWRGHVLFVFYPFLAWSGLMMLGYCFGRLYLKFEGHQRKKVLLLLGVGVLVFFALLRATNEYGDPRHWATQKNGLYTFLSFMNVQKYPPSLLYTCATIGIGIIFLALTGNVKNGFTKFVTVYGRVPFLYYILHFLLIHLITSICFIARGHTIAEGLQWHPNAIVPQFIAPGEGYSLFTVYLIWICIVLSLYPVCKWFSEYKQAHREKWWLSYL